MLVAVVEDRLGRSVGHVVAVLHRGYGRRPLRLEQLVDRHLREPDVSDLAFALKRNQLSERIADRHVGIHAVQLQQVDALELQVAQRQLDLLAKIIGPAQRGPALGALTSEAGLRRDHDLLGVGGEGIVQELLGDERPVGVGGVEERDAPASGDAQHADRLVAIVGRTPDPVARELHGAEPEAVDPQIAGNVIGTGLGDGRGGHGGVADRGDHA
jgi:hypothetical protein